MWRDERKKKTKYSIDNNALALPLKSRLFHLNTWTLCTDSNDGFLFQFNSLAKVFVLFSFLLRCLFFVFANWIFLQQQKNNTHSHSLCFRMTAAPTERYIPSSTTSYRHRLVGCLLCYDVIRMDVVFYFTIADRERVRERLSARQ